MTLTTPRLLATSAAISVLFLVNLAFAEDSPTQPLPWKRGPGSAPIGDLAEIGLDDSYVYLDDAGTKRFMELNQNPVSGAELATIAPISDQENWFLVFEFEPIGYVKDDEQDSLDADALLASIREGTQAANEERSKRGWSTLEILGWQEKPHYDARTHNLSWAVTAQSDGRKSVNRIVKLLGRRGVMTVTLVSPVETLNATIPVVDTMLDGYHFKSGHTYGEFVPGTDKLAEYGLTALIVGGAGAALVKSGLLAKLWKPIVVGAMALGASAKRLLFGGRKVAKNLEGPIV